MKRLQRQSLLDICDQFGCYAWDDAEISELVDPQIGIITGFQELLDQLERLSRLTLDRFHRPSIFPLNDCTTDLRVDR